MTRQNNERCISFFKQGITQIRNGREITLTEWFEMLHSTVVKQKCEWIQAINDPDPKVQKKKRNLIKRDLGYATFAGTFQSRKNNDIQTLSGFAAIDLDNLKKDQIVQWKEKLSQDQYIRGIFISPSGEGLKLIIEIPQEREKYSAYVESFYIYLSETYQISFESLDKSTHDISRACYLSYDPDAILKTESIMFEVIDPSTSKTLSAKKTDNTRSAKEYREIIRLLYCGTSKSEIFAQLQSFSKWNEAPEAYREHTYNKALQYVEANPPKTEEKQNLVNDLAETILKEFYIYTERIEKEPQMYVYEDGIYKDNGRTILAEFIHSKIGKYYTKELARRIIDKIEVETYITPSELYTEEAKQYICVQNGILNLFTKEIKPFSPKYRFFQKLPITFDPSKTCDATQEHFQTILHDEDIPLMQELYGYLLYRDYPFEKAFLFSGDGGNGKGKTLEQMKHFVGSENTISLDLATLEETGNGFMVGNLHTKLVNLGADIGKSRIQETRNFKQLTGHDEITSNRKHKSPITFVNYAKMIFAANEIPPIDDKTDGFYRRWCIIRFDVAFKDKLEYERLKIEGKLLPHYRIANTSIIETLTTDEELSGVLNWALDGLNRLFTQKGFSYAKTEQMTKQLMLKYSSTVLRFYSDCIQKIPNVQQYETHDDLYNAYLQYCMNPKRNFMPENEIKFKTLMQEVLSLKRATTATGVEFRWNFARLLPEEEVSE